MPSAAEKITTLLLRTSVPANTTVVIETDPDIEKLGAARIKVFAPGADAIMLKISALNAFLF